MLRAFVGLVIALPREPYFDRFGANGLVIDRMPQSGQFGRQLFQAFGGSGQRAHRIACCRRLDDLAEFVHKGRRLVTQVAPAPLDGLSVDHASAIVVFAANRKPTDVNHTVTRERIAIRLLFEESLGRARVVNATNGATARNEAQNTPQKCV